VPAGRRAAVFDEALRVLRQLLREDDVSFEGEFFRFENLTIGPRPAKPMDIWLGGFAPAGLRRAGRYADGWLASFITPDEARYGREAIQAAAAEAGREIEEDHFGISIAIATDGIPAELAAVARERRPGVDPADLIPQGWAQTRTLIERYVDAGLTKFVVRPVAADLPFESFVDSFATELMPLEN
jgi:probable F420-dependent oxidoreductase